MNFKSTRTSDLARSAEARRDHIRPDGVRKIHLASSVYRIRVAADLARAARNARGHAGIPAERPFRRFPAPALPFPVPASEQENILHVISVYLPQIVVQSYGMTVLFRRRPAQRARDSLFCMKTGRNRETLPDQGTPSAVKDGATRRRRAKGSPGARFDRRRFRAQDLRAAGSAARA